MGEREIKNYLTLTFGFCDFRYCPTPETVPPLPIPITNISTCPFVSSHISGPVVSKCTCFFQLTIAHCFILSSLNDHNIQKKVCLTNWQSTAQQMGNTRVHVT